MEYSLIREQHDTIQQQPVHGYNHLTPVGLHQQKE